MGLCFRAKAIDIGAPPLTASRQFGNLRREKTTRLHVLPGSATLEAEMGTAAP